MMPSTYRVTGLGLAIAVIVALGASKASAAPAPADATTETCADDAAWSGGRKGKNCAWASGLKKFKLKKQCGNKKYQRFCPLTCGVCTPADTDTPDTGADSATGRPTQEEAAAECSKTMGDLQKALDAMHSTQYTSVGGKPLPNFESPAVAYAHAEHCKGVVASGEPDADASRNEMEVMHFRHCAAAVEKVNRQLDAGNHDGDRTLGAATCAKLFPQLEIGKGFEFAPGEWLSDMFDYGFNYGFNYRRQRDTANANNALRSVGVGGRLDKSNLDFAAGSVPSGRDGLDDKPAAGWRQQRPTVMPVDAMAADNFAGVLMKQFKQQDLSELEAQYVKLMGGQQANKLAVQAFQCQN